MLREDCKHCNNLTVCKSNFSREFDTYFNDICPFYIGDQNKLI
jgi:hypothetical protein